MALQCTRCESSGFLNLGQIDQDILESHDNEQIIEWIKANENHDVQVCDCCGDSEGWYGNPGEHYTNDDPRGDRGPYAYNGGLCECN